MIKLQGFSVRWGDQVLGFVSLWGLLGPGVCQLVGIARSWGWSGFGVGVLRLVSIGFLIYRAKSVSTRGSFTLVWDINIHHRKRTSKS